MEFFEETSVFWPIFFMHQLTRKLQNLKNSDKLYKGNEHRTFILPRHTFSPSLLPSSMPGHFSGMGRKASQAVEKRGPLNF